MTICLIAIAAVIVWRLNTLIVLVVWLFFITFDGLFLSASLTKVPKSAWFTLLLAIIMCSVILLWRLSDITTWQLKCWLMYESEGSDIKLVDEAQKTQTVFLLGKESLTPKLGSGKTRRVLLAVFVWLREQATSKASVFHLPTEQVVEIGLVREISRN